MVHHTKNMKNVWGTIQKKWILYGHHTKYMGNHTKKTPKKFLKNGVLP